MCFAHIIQFETSFDVKASRNTHGESSKSQKQHQHPSLPILRISCKEQRQESRNHAHPCITQFPMTDPAAQMILTFVHDLKLGVNNSAHSETQPGIKVTGALISGRRLFTGVCCLECDGKIWSEMQPRDMHHGIMGHRGLVTMGRWRGLDLNKDHTLDPSTGLWLVDTDHVTWALASYWSSRDPGPHTVAPALSWSGFYFLWFTSVGPEAALGWLWPTGGLELSCQGVHYTRINTDPTRLSWPT